MSNLKGRELEIALLGLILEDPSVWGKTRGYLEPSDFSDLKNQVIFEAMIGIAKSGFETIEIPALMNWLSENNKLIAIGGEEYLSELINSAGYASNHSSYLKEINSESRLRKVRQVLKSSLMDIDSKNSDIEQVIENIEAQILNATRDESVSDFETINTVVDRAQKEMNQKLSGDKPTGLKTDFPSVDEHIGGFQPGNLIILAARPGMGKTTFAINLATNISRKGNVAFFSLEMSNVDIVNRIISSTSLISGKKIKDPKKMSENEVAIVNNKYDELKKLNFFLDDSANIRLADLLWKAKKLHKTNPLELLVVDYLQLLTIGTSQSENRQGEVSIISRALKQLARELEIPIIALSQLSRKIESRENKRPLLSDLRESGSIEQDADIIVFIHRDHNKEHEDSKVDSSGIVPVELVVAKHRAGSTGSVNLSFKPDILTFYDVGGK